MLTPRRGGAGPLNGVRVEVDTWVGSEWRLRWSAYPLGGAVCSYLTQYPAFAPDTSEVAVGFLVFLYLIVHNLPQWGVGAVIFSLL